MAWNGLRECVRCLVEDHRQHVTTSVEFRLSQLKERFRYHLQSSYRCTLGYQQRRDTLSQVLERTLSQEEELVRRITDSYDDLMRQVTKRRDELIHEAWAHFLKCKREISLRIQHVIASPGTSGTALMHGSLSSWRRRLVSWLEPTPI